MNVIRLHAATQLPADALVASAVAALSALAGDATLPARLRQEAHRARVRLVETDSARDVLLRHQDAQAEADGL